MGVNWNKTWIGLRRGCAVAGLAALLIVVLPTVGVAAAPPASLEEAVSQVERAHDGRLLSARVEPRNGGAVYVIRWLTEGQQVRTFEIPAAEHVRP